MKSIIIYFSQTGNTEKIAKAIQTGIKQTIGRCDIAKIKDANPRRLFEYDLIGLGSPVFGTEPGNVRAFINNMRFVGGKHIFVFCTHGGVPIYFFPSIIPVLKKRGVVVIGTQDWYGDCSELHHIYPYPTAGHPDEIDLKEAQIFGSEMVERSRRISAGEIGLIPPLPKKIPQVAPEESVSIKIIKAFPTKGVKFHAEKCLYPKCRLCMDNCPMDGIDLTVKPPVIAKPCLICSFCGRICPTGAIDIQKWEEALAATTVPLTRNIILPTIAEAEAEGHFRRLLPAEQIGGKPNYKIFNKHPQWIIGKGYNR
jgi:flavodoxin/ferredoxin